MKSRRSADRLEEVDARINEARAEVQRLQNQIASHRNRIDFNRERAQELTALIERYELDVETAADKLAQQETEIHDTDLLLAETERLLAAKQTELAELNDRAAEVATGTGRTASANCNRLSCPSPRRKTGWPISNPKSPAPPPAGARPSRAWRNWRRR